MADSRTFEVETSITLDYRKERWGLERIVLDGISNHLPADSGGQHTQVKLKQGGVWVELKNADPALQTEEVMFDDDGKGYTSQKLSTLRSTKGADVLSVGQFGEGLKLVAAAALRHDLQLQYGSRNWVAAPFKRPETDDGEHYDRLCFRITENGDTLKGSRTLFFNPTAEFLQEVFKLPSKVLALNDSYRELHHEKDNYGLFDFKFYNIILRPDTPRVFNLGNFLDYSGVDPSTFGLDFSQPAPQQRYHSRIIDLGTAEKAIFVKGIRVQTGNLLFSYDLGVEDITPDRTYASLEVMLNKMEMLLKGCTNQEVITTLLKAAEDQHKSYDEFQALNQSRKRKAESFPGFHKIYYNEESERLGHKIKLSSDTAHPWVHTFRTLYGENAVVASDDTNINNDAKLLGFTPVHLNHHVEQYLLELGIESAAKVATGTKEYKWVDHSTLTPAELEVYNLVPDLNKAAFGSETAVPIDQVRIYEGMFFASGREAESDLGVTITNMQGGSTIGIKRSVLADKESFATTYFHEAGHYMTKQADYTRGHTDFGYAHMAALSLEKIAAGK